ncbi:DUF401 family protein [Moorella sulfitireducens]|uniref:DUF401 family protein n=1 Tax=Neomoorella sulfitireducens TaxID=2972948 RepID=UPI0021ABC024|nr:DUF401 family protein [Moorella sulfitireducens]
MLLVFVIMMVFLGRRVSLLPVLLGGSLLLAALYHTGPLAFLEMAWQATISPATLELEVILALIMLFEHLLGQQGYLDRMLRGLRGLIRNRRLVIALLPAFIGLMPSAGGALFSAPLVGRAASRTNIAAEEKSFINYYYRHIWEYFLPLYPGVLLASRLSGIPLPRLIAVLAPYGLLVILLGIPALRRIKIEAGDEGREEALAGEQAPAREFILSILPVLVVVALVLLFHVEVGLAVGVVLLYLLVRHRYTPVKFWHLCKKAVAVKTLLLVWGVMLFKEVLVDTRAVEGLPSILAMLPVPEFLLFGLISFLVGMMTGLMVACIGIVFPIVMSTVDGQMSLPLAVFVFIAGFTGNMLTPMHLCLALTVDFFKADLRKVLKMMVVPEVALLAVALAVYLVF